MLDMEGAIYPVLCIDIGVVIIIGLIMHVGGGEA